MTSDEWGVYLHLIWCRRRCSYCSFHTEVDPKNEDTAARDHRWRKYRDALLSEFDSRAASFPNSASSLFFGGGTPSRAPTSILSDIISHIRPSKDAEVTVEANPEDIDAQWCQSAADAGVNRLSLGLQTFSPEQARLLNRASSVAHAIDIAHVVADAGFTSWSLDLIFGLPNQSKADFDLELESAIELGAPHISLYGLTVEEGTGLARAVSSGQISIANPHHWRNLYDHAVDKLKSAGIERYEVSNFAKPGHQSRHNRSIWRYQPYMGLGPSAHGFYPNGIRYSNNLDLDGYLRSPTNSQQSERPSSIDAATDYLLGSVRLSEGVDLEFLKKKLGYVIPTQCINGHTDKGTMTIEKSRLRLTNRGYPLADALIRDLVEGLVQITQPISGTDT